MFFFVHPPCKDRVPGKNRQRGGHTLEMGLLNLRFYRGENGVWSPVNHKTHLKKQLEKHGRRKSRAKGRGGRSQKSEGLLKATWGIFPGQRDMTHQTRAHRGSMRL